LIYLNSGLLKPAIVLTSVVMLPISILCWLLLFDGFRMSVFIVSLLLTAAYFLIVFGIFKSSKTKKYWLCIENNFIHVNYPFYNNQCDKIDVSKIVKVEYYKISSFKAWCMLYSCVCPQCVYITYINDGKEICRHIGYPEFNEIKKVCLDIGVDFLVK